jgi:hypothetical protein
VAATGHVTTAERVPKAEEHPARVLEALESDG